ncbi:DNA methyltransferase, partial [Paenibacillus graminis]
MKTVDQNHNIRSAKRGKNERIGIHGWHLYYAGYSESFVEDIIKYMGVNEESIILDPWMGSGTTAVVCQKLGIQSFGNELNPAMVTFGRAKSAKLLDSDLPALVNHIISYTQSNTIHPVLD